MDGNRFDGITRSLTRFASRRSLLGGVLGSAGSWLGALGSDAKPKRRKQRKRPKPAKPNQYGCLEIKDPCRRHSQCCSGICTGQPGRKRCRAHGTGSCIQTNLAFCEAASQLQTLCNNSNLCACTRTTAGSAFCGSLAPGAQACASCKRDADCVALGFPPGSACAPLGTGNCAGACPTGMMCMAPCPGYQPPAP